jgi:O-antigen/teichoic acid export membrane protein
MTKPNPDENLVETAGRGVIYITFAKMWFMLTGWALIFGLPRIFKWASDGDVEKGQALFGAYKLVIMGVSFINNGIITGTIQAVSKFTSEDESGAEAVKRTALKVQGGLGIAIAVLYIGFAGLLADILGSPDLAMLMRLSAGIIVAYSCYAVFIGSFNGRRLFSRQALFDITYSTIKTALIVGLAAVGFEVLGTVVGFLLAAIVIAVAAAVASGWSGSGSFSAKRYLKFAALLIAYTFGLNLVMSLDLFLLKGIASDLAIESGMNVEAASAAGKALAGQYGAAQGLAFIPYQAILSIAFVAFPMISKATFENDMQKTRDYIRKTLRFSAIIIIGLTSVFTALPGQALALIFPPEYQAASDALGVLSLGMAAFSLLVVSNTILNSAGLVRRTMALIATTLIAVVGAVAALATNAGPGPDALAATALGSTAGMCFGLIISAVAVYRRFGTFWPWATALRVGAAGALTIGFGRVVLPFSGKLITIFECIAVVAVYVIALVVTREFRLEDLDQLKQVIKHKNRS